MLFECLHVCFQLLSELLFIFPLLLHLASSFLFIGPLLPAERFNGRLLVKEVLILRVFLLDFADFVLLLSSCLLFALELRGELGNFLLPNSELLSEGLQFGGLLLAVHCFLDLDALGRVLLFNSFNLSFKFGLQLNFLPIFRFPVNSLAVLGLFL